MVAVKGLDGTPAVALRQALYDGTLSERVMISLKNYNSALLDFNSTASTITLIL